MTEPGYWAPILGASGPNRFDWVAALREVCKIVSR